MDMQVEHPADAERAIPDSSYEPPQVERVITADDMEREVMFAGPAITNGDTGVPVG